MLLRYAFEDCDVGVRWAGHVVRMSDDRLPKQLFYGELATGKRPRHKPKKRFKDCLKNSMKDLDIDHDNWEETARNRAAWRTEVRKGCKSLCSKRMQRAKLKRDLRKGNIENLPSDSANWTCETCGRILLSKAGYVNHMKSHQRNPPARTVPPQPDSTTCAVCGKVCKSASGLKRHMAVHKEDIQHPDPINPVKTLTFVCHVSSNNASTLCPRSSPFRSFFFFPTHLYGSPSPLQP